jgi:hypothetical protein
MLSGIRISNWLSLHARLTAHMGLPTVTIWLSLQQRAVRILDGRPRPQVASNVVKFCMMMLAATTGISSIAYKWHLRDIYGSK